MASDIDAKQFGLALGQRVARVRDELRAELIEHIDALAAENRALRAEVVGLKTRVAVLEAAQEKSK